MDTKTLCLGALSMGDASGYEIRKMFEEGVFQQFQDTSFGSIYPALNTLAKDGLISCKEYAQDGKPDKKVYSLTPLGWQAFLSRLNGPLAQDKFRSDFCFTLFFGHHLSRRRRTEVLDAYLNHLKGQVAGMTERHGSDDCLTCNDARSGNRFLYGLGLTFYRSTIDYIESNRHILEDGPDLDTESDR